jgi:hypothetical protein
VAKFVLPRRYTRGLLRKRNLSVTGAGVGGFNSDAIFTSDGIVSVVVPFGAGIDVNMFAFVGVGGAGCVASTNAFVVPDDFIERDTCPAPSWRCFVRRTPPQRERDGGTLRHPQALHKPWATNWKGWSTFRAQAGGISPLSP